MIAGILGKAPRKAKKTGHAHVVLDAVSLGENL
jgi:hypothetical protein